MINNFQEQTHPPIDRKYNQSLMPLSVWMIPGSLYIVGYRAQMKAAKVSSIQETPFLQSQGMAIGCVRPFFSTQTFSPQCPDKYGLEAN